MTLTTVMRFMEMIHSSGLVNSVHLPAPGNSASVRLDPPATPAQQALIDGFNWGDTVADAAYLAGTAHGAAVTQLTKPGALFQLLRAVIVLAARNENQRRAGQLHPITSITRSSQTATVTTTGPHGLSTGNQVAIAGADAPAYNGVKSITVTGANTFTYNGVSGNPATPATGSIFYAERGSAIPPTPQLDGPAVLAALTNTINAGEVDATIPNTL